MTNQCTEALRRLLLLTLLGMAGTAQAGESQCILAGRLSPEQGWAPRTGGVELLAQDGQRIMAASKAALAGVTQVRVSKPALLSACDGAQAITPGAQGGAKTAVPAISPGTQALVVQAVNFPPLRVGGELVELQVLVPEERRVMLTR